MNSSTILRSLVLPRAVLVLAAIPGCFEPVPPDYDPSEELDTMDEDDDEPEAMDVGSSGMDEPADGVELLSNGSFEAWSGGMPQAWTDGDAALEEIVVDGDRALRVSSTVYNSVGQRVVTPLPAGSCLELSLSVRWESGSNDAPVVQLLGRDEADMDHEQFVALEWSGDGQWRDTLASFAATDEAWTSFSLHVLSTAPVEQGFSIDDASLLLVPCT